MSERYKKYKVVSSEDNPLLEGVITYTMDNLGAKKYTFSLQRTFIKGGEQANTCWFKREDVVFLKQLLDDLTKELEVAEVYAKEEQKEFLRSTKK